MSAYPKQQLVFLTRVRILGLDPDPDPVVLARIRRAKKKRVEVLTYLITKDDKKEMTYKLYKSKKKGWMVYDVDVLGVSIVQTYRSQFSGILKKESMEQLMERMRSSGELGS